MAEYPRQHDLLVGISAFAPDFSSQLAGRNTKVALSNRTNWAMKIERTGTRGTLMQDTTTRRSHSPWIVSAVAVAIFALCSPGVAAVCGDSEPDAGEQCDDGNSSNGDGCSSSCQIEPRFDCTAAIGGIASENVVVDGSFENNDPAWTLIGSAFPPLCTAICGVDLATDGEAYLWIGGGFFTAGNDATATQAVVIPESATSLSFDWLSRSNASPDGTCESPAGDLLELLIDDVQVFRTSNPCSPTSPAVTEIIDLAAAGVNDGMEHTLQFHGVNVDDPVAPNTSLTNFFMDNVRIDVPLADPVLPTPSMCFAAVCGDGILSSAETCDDGNTVSGDGCSSVCTLEEPDYVCTDPLLNAFDVLANTNGDAIREGGLEDRRGRISQEWNEFRVDVDNLLPICSEVRCPFFSVNLAKDGVFFALFGASRLPSDTSISQRTTIPTTATVLTFDFRVASPLPLSGPVGVCDSTDDFLVVTVDGTPVFTYECTEPVDDYTRQTADITDFADGLTHTIRFRGVTKSINGSNTNFFVDNISIPLPTPAEPMPGVCTKLPTSCGPVETFDAGIPPSWTVVNLGADPADGWGTTNDGICLSQNAMPHASLFGQNLTSATGGAACADSDATGQVDVDGGGNSAEMDTYLCTNALDLSTITGPSLTFATNYQAADNRLNDNGTFEDLTDDVDDDVLEVVAGVLAPSPTSVVNYAALQIVDDHEDDDLSLTGAQEVRVSLRDPLEGQQEGYVCFRYRGTSAWFALVDNVALRGSSCVISPGSDVLFSSGFE